MPRIGPNSSAARPGSASFVTGGTAKTDCSSTLVASRMPFASTISPRSAGLMSSVSMVPRSFSRTIDSAVDTTAVIIAM